MRATSTTGGLHRRATNTRLMTEIVHTALAYYYATIEDYRDELAMSGRDTPST